MNTSCEWELLRNAFEKCVIQFGVPLFTHHYSDNSGHLVLRITKFEKIISSASA
jgi:hypothetical protein